MVAQAEKARQVRPPPVSPRLRLALAPWDALDSEAAALIPFDSPAEHLDDLQAEVEAGRAACYHVETRDGGRLGLVVVRVEEHPAGGRELLLLAVYARPAPDLGPLRPEIFALCLDLARAERCRSMRFHTVRPALARVAAKQFGFRLAELVMRHNIP